MIIGEYNIQIYIDPIKYSYIYHKRELNHL